jgi:hypothetical protein
MSLPHTLLLFGIKRQQLAPKLSFFSRS